MTGAPAAELVRLVSDRCRIEREPENILLQRGCPLGADFGMARAASPAAANPVGHPVGAPKNLFSRCRRVIHEACEEGGAECGH
jgi:hypothetical protein